MKKETAIKTRAALSVCLAFWILLTSSVSSYAFDSSLPSAADSEIVNGPRLFSVVPKDSAKEHSTQTGDKPVPDRIRTEGAGTKIAPNILGSDAPAADTGASLTKVAKMFEIVNNPGKYAIPEPIEGGTVTGALPDESLRPFYAQSINWGSVDCKLFARSDQEYTRVTKAATDNGRELECAYAIMPLDYSKPEGQKVAVAISRLRAKDADGRKGAVFSNPGGPGGSGIFHSARKLGSETFRKAYADYDLIGMDSRGVRNSLPQLNCLSEQAMYDQGTRKTSQAEKDAQLQYLGQQCLSVTTQNFPRVSSEEFLKNMRTMNVARDLDVLRSALGNEKLNYYGYSYGTRLGGQYVQMFPKNVGSFILDGTMTPFVRSTPATEAFTAKYISSNSTIPRTQQEAAQVSLKDAVRRCLEGDPVVIQNVGRCGLLPPAENFEDSASSEDTPSAHESTGTAAMGTVTDEEIEKAVRKILVTIAVTEKGTGALKDGTPGEGQASIPITYGMIWGWLADANVFLNELNLKYWNKILDELRIWDGYAELYEQYNKNEISEDSFVNAALPLLAGKKTDELARLYKTRSDSIQQSEFLAIAGVDGLWTYGVDPYYTPNTWQINPDEQVLNPESPLEGLPPILVISESNDPATPFWQGPLMGRILRGVFVGVSSPNHGSVFANNPECSDLIAGAYLKDPVRFPARVAAGEFDTPKYTGPSGVLTRNERAELVRGNTCAIYNYAVLAPLPDTQDMPDAAETAGDNPAASSGEAGVDIASASGAVAGTASGAVGDAVERNASVERAGSGALANTGYGELPVTVLGWLSLGLVVAGCVAAAVGARARKRF